MLYCLMSIFGIEIVDFEGFGLFLDCLMSIFGFEIVDFENFPILNLDSVYQMLYFLRTVTRLIFVRLVSIN